MKFCERRKSNQLINFKANSVNTFCVLQTVNRIVNRIESNVIKFYDSVKTIKPCKSIDLQGF
jgi:hypothetical protein